MADKIAVVICSLLARWWRHYSFSISSTFVGPIHYKLICSLLARWWRHVSISIIPRFVRPIHHKLICSLLAWWWRHVSFSISPTFVGPINYKLIRSLLARWCSSDKGTGRDHKGISTIHCINQTKTFLREIWSTGAPVRLTFFGYTL